MNNQDKYFKPKKYKNKLLFTNDYLEVLESFLLIDPQRLNHQHRTKQYQLVKLIDVYAEDEYIDEILVSLASNGNYIKLNPSVIMGIARPEDVILWESLYGNIHSEEGDSDCIFYNIDDAIDNTTQVERYMDNLLDSIRFAYGSNKDCQIDIQHIDNKDK